MLNYEQLFTDVVTSRKEVPLKEGDEFYSLSDIISETVRRYMTLKLKLERCQITLRHAIKNSTSLGNKVRGGLSYNRLSDTVLLLVENTQKEYKMVISNQYEVVESSVNRLKEGFPGFLKKRKSRSDYGEVLSEILECFVVTVGNKVFELFEKMSPADIAFFTGYSVEEHYIKLLYEPHTFLSSDALFFHLVYTTPNGNKINIEYNVDIFDNYFKVKKVERRQSSNNPKFKLLDDWLSVNEERILNDILFRKSSFSFKFLK